MRRPTIAFLASVLALAVAAGVSSPLSTSPERATAPTATPASPTPASPTPTEEGDEPRGANEEAEEQAERTEQRLEALAEAIAEGRFGQEQAVTGTPARGWLGEQVLDATTDDWEPAIAADLNAPFVYLLTTRYGEPKPCQGNCPVPFITLTVSKDGGTTWGRTRPLCACKGSGQFDPIIEVVPDTGEVYALYMNGYNVVFVKSSDRGKTWTEPVPTWGKVSWNDKPILTTDATGTHVYASWNGPQGGDAWVAQSHDDGAIWTQTKLTNSKTRYYFAFDGTVLPDGTVVISEGSVTYTAPGANPEGVVKQHAFVSEDLGATWTNVVVDTVEVGEPCADCRADYYIGHSSVSSDARGRVVFVYDGATQPFGPQRIYVRRSRDGGLTWSGRRALSVAGENATAPAVEATGRGDVRLFYFQTANGDDPDLWNVWYRSSRDGGHTWSRPVNVSDADSGADYKTPEGFMEPYGDYGEIAINSAGQTVAAWGEGFSWLGPGGAWTNVQV